MLKSAKDPSRWLMIARRYRIIDRARWLSTKIDREHEDRSRWHATITFEHYLLLFFSCSLCSLCCSECTSLRHSTVNSRPRVFTLTIVSEHVFFSEISSDLINHIAYVFICPFSIVILPTTLFTCLHLNYPHECHHVSSHSIAWPFIAVFHQLTIQINNRAAAATARAKSIRCCRCCLRRRRRSWAVYYWRRISFREASPPLRDWLVGWAMGWKSPSCLMVCIIRDSLLLGCMHWMTRQQSQAQDLNIVDTSSSHQRRSPSRLPLRSLSHQLLSLRRWFQRLYKLRHCGWRSCEGLETGGRCVGLS